MILLMKEDITIIYFTYLVSKVLELNLKLVISQIIKYRRKKSIIETKMPVPYIKYLT